jgi:hypothetical protein
VNTWRDSGARRSAAVKRNTTGGTHRSARR